MLPAPAPTASIIVIDPDRAQASLLEVAVRPLGQLIWCTNTAEAVTRCIKTELIFIAGLTRSARDTVQCLHELQTRFLGSACILVAEYGDYMQLDSSIRTRDNFLLAFRPFEIPKFMVQLDRAANAVKLASQLAKMRDVLGREKTR